MKTDKQPFSKIQNILQVRETAILKMNEKLNQSHSLNRILLESLRTSIGSNDFLSYDDKQKLKQETTDCSDAIKEFELARDTNISINEKNIKRIDDEIDLAH